MPFLIALLAGAASVLAYAPFGQFWLMPLSWGVLFVLLRKDSVRPGRGFMLGWAWGAGALFAGLCWLVVALHRFGGMPASLSVFLILLFSVALALYPALSACLFVRLRSGKLWPDALLAAASWTMGELLRGYVFTGFPWLVVGYTQTPPSPLAGWAPVLGVYGVGFLLVLSSVLLVLGFINRHQRRAALLGVALIWGAGAALRHVPWTQPVGEPVQVALIQPNVAQDQKWQSARILDWLRLNLDLVQQQSARIVVLPETTLPMLEHQLPSGYLDALGESARAHGGDVILGVFAQDGERIFNSAITRGTAPPQQYSKHHLVPFGEFSPPMFEWFFRLVSIPMADQTRGPVHQPPLLVGGQRIAVNICYEDVFGEELLYALPDATLMLNLSNLAWYGDSHAQPQHLQIARMRALETGRPMLRSTNTGMTAIVQPDGRVSEVLPPFTTGVISASVQGYSGSTPYSRTGNLSVLLLVLAVLGWCGRLRYRSHAATFSA